MTRYYLPLAVKVLKTALYEPYSNILGSTIATGDKFSPLVQLSELVKGTDPPPFWKIAFLKECGRALVDLSRNRRRIHFAERFSKIAPSEELAKVHHQIRKPYQSLAGGASVCTRKCPVCDKKALVSDLESDYDTEIVGWNDDGEPEQQRGDLVSTYVGRVTCFHCSFQLDSADFMDVKSFLGVSFSELFKDLMDRG